MLSLTEAKQQQNQARRIEKQTAKIQLQELLHPGFRTVQLSEVGGEITGRKQQQRNTTDDDVQPVTPPTFPVSVRMQCQ
jgi:hypothetical protein